MIISNLTINDVNEAVELASICFGEHMRLVAEEDFNATFECASYVPKTFIGTRDGKIIALVQSHVSSMQSNLQSFSWLCVHPDYRGMGLGHAILAHAEQETIQNRFKDQQGAFLLHSGIDPAFYHKAGYRGQTLSYDNAPFLSKPYKPS